MTASLPSGDAAKKERAGTDTSGGGKGQIGLKRRRMAILGIMWSVSIALFVFAASGARPAENTETGNGSMTGDDVGFQITESVEGNDGETTVRVSGCLSESELASLFGDKLEGAVEDISVRIGKDMITLYGTLAADEDKILEMFPSLEDYALIIKIADGAPVEAQFTMEWSPESGFTAGIGRVTVFDVEVPTKDLNKTAQKIQNGMNGRFEGAANVKISRWELLPGGLYYSAELPDEESISLLYPSL